MRYFELGRFAEGSDIHAFKDVRDYITLQSVCLFYVRKSYGKMPKNYLINNNGSIIECIALSVPFIERE